MFRLAFLAFSLLGGCIFIRPSPEPIRLIESRTSESHRSDCLVVFFPGFADRPTSFATHGMFDTVHSAGRCDAIAVDAHLGYYQSGTLTNRVYRDVLLHGELLGYREFWLVGVSMGGLGSLLVAKSHPELVRGVILLAPFLGDRDVLDAIRASGGLGHWSAPPIDDPNSREQYSEALWLWLRAQTSETGGMPIYLGYGTDDPLAADATLLAAELPPERVHTTPGGHNWAAFQPLFRDLLARQPL